MKTVIVLSGKKGVGKDTTADIIKDYFKCRDCFGTGYKDADYSYIAELCETCKGGYFKNVKKLSFAGPLKKVCMKLFGLSEKQCFGKSDSRNEESNLFWSDLSPKYHALKNENSSKKLTAREVLQIFGTNVCREFYGNIWSNAALVQTIHEFKNGTNIVVLTDARFPNEIDVFKRAEQEGKIKLFVIRIHRDTGFYDNHPSEIALDDYQFENNIVNNGDKRELGKAVARFLRDNNV